jgi:hypothetical protein
MKKKCFWCNCSLDGNTTEDKYGISPHSTWCPHYRNPPPVYIGFNRAPRVLAAKLAAAFPSIHTPVFTPFG